MSWERPFEPESSGTGGTGGVTDHGALTGLADDDHPQYLTQAEADAVYKTLGYIPSWAEITGKPSTFPPSTHNHDTAYAALGHVGSRDGHPVATTTLDGLMAGAENAKLGSMASPAMASSFAKTGTVLVSAVVKEVQLQAPTILSGDITYDAATGKFVVGSSGKYLCGFFVLFVSGTTADGAVLFSRIHVDAGSNTIGASHTGSTQTFGTSSSALLSLTAGQRVLPAGFWFGGGSPQVSDASSFYMLKVGL